MTLLLLYFEFFKIGLFAIGGGLATLPFLIDLAAKRPEWMSMADISNMVAVSESTPGPMGINMATYVGNNVMSIPGAVVATLGEITPSIIIIIAVAGILNAFKNNKYVNYAFYGLRAVVIALIGYAAYRVYTVAFIGSYGLDYMKICLSVLLLVMMCVFRKIHPIVWIVIAAVIGIILPI